MWVNQDQMFADGPEISEEDKKAIEFLDSLACKIADGTVEVEEFDLTTNYHLPGLDWTDTTEKIEIIYK